MMQDITMTSEPLVMDNFNLTNMFSPDQNTMERTAYNPVYTNLAAEGDENFFHYLNWLGLSNEPNLLVLSSRHHYYYDYDDLKGVRVLVNLKSLNVIRHLDSFLHVVFRMLPPRASFIGCFTENKRSGARGLSLHGNTSIFNRFINFLDSRIERYLDREDVKKILESHGFSIVDMTEIDGKVYFISRNKRIETAD
ncbi:MAG: hypothetical protein RBU28_03045 [Bacteroidales bacterium]|nr:hypothetical protein [Bacteroidales bacterium]